jgi:transcriptional regulator GlxA family with amidase domain
LGRLRYALADVARMSRRTFTRRFREATGMTVNHWLAAERIGKAQQLLKTTDLPIEHVAAEAGFGTSLSLRQHFAQQVRTSPSAYRRAFATAGRGANSRVAT